MQKIQKKDRHFKAPRKRLAKIALSDGRRIKLYLYKDADDLPKNFGNIKITGIDGREHKLSDMLEKGPISALTDMNIGSRTSYDGMWFRDWKEGATTKETVTNMITANLGPSVSIGSNMLSGVDDFGNGKLGRGAEKFAPAFFKAPLVAARLHSPVRLSAEQTISGLSTPA